MTSNPPNQPITLTSTHSSTINSGVIVSTTPPATNVYKVGSTTTYASGVSLSLTNYGVLSSVARGVGEAYTGVFLTVGGSVAGGNAVIKNGAGDIISGYQYGVDIRTGANPGAFVSIFNAGTIASTAPAGKNGALSAGVFVGNEINASVTNHSGAIYGGEGVWLQTDNDGTDTVINDAGASIVGTIAANGIYYGIKIQDNPGSGLVGTGNIYNAGFVGGIVDDAALTSHITNASTGTFSGGIFALGTGTLTLDAGETLIGSVQFADGLDSNTITPLATLVLAGAAGELGVLSDPGSFTGFGAVTVASGDTWSLGTSASAAGFSGVPTISNFGTIDLAGRLSGNTIDMEGTLGVSSVVDFTGSDTSTPIVDFGALNTLVLNSGLFTGAAGDQLETMYTNGVLTIEDVKSGANVNITLSGAPGTQVTSANFVAAFDSSGHLVITDMPCFAAGTRILTSNGQVAVETLGVGDTVLTLAGAARPVVWVGQRTIDLSRHADPEKAMPVRILAGAFGPGLPARDLRLSPDHALFIDGHLIEAKTLVNGATVLRETGTRFVTYHHIELDQHDVVLAEGLPAESYLDSNNRGNFAQDAAPVALHADFAAQCRAAACAPLLLNGPLVTATRQRLLDRAIALGFTRTDEIDLAAKVGNETLRATAEGTNKILFAVPADATTVALLSGAGVPAELHADPSDRRVLGAAITGLALVANGQRQEIDLHDAAHQGFHASEGTHRWTNGDAHIALPAYAGAAVLEVSFAGQAARWAAFHPAETAAA